VQSAERVFVEHGFLGASIGEIARTAGYTTGAVYSNFASKEDLGMAVIAERMLRAIVALQAELAAAEPTPQARLQALETWSVTVLGDENWVVLVTEFLLAARHKPEVRSQFNAGLRKARSIIACILDDQRRQLGLEFPMDAKQLAAAVMGLGMGLSVLRISDPELDTGTFVAAVNLLLGRADPGLTPGPTLGLS
jgi:AcrR family transcriptional regulator